MNKTNFQIHPINTSSDLSLPYTGEGIKAGFPSPTQDYLETAI